MHTAHMPCAHNVVTTYWHRTVSSHQRLRALGRAGGVGRPRPARRCFHPSGDWARHQRSPRSSGYRRAARPLGL